MADSSVPNPDNFQKSALYQEFLAEREEILRHKWIESEKVGHDIGFEKALLDWIVKHRANWRVLRPAALIGVRAFQREPVYGHGARVSPLPGAP
jgi:hypothetical protein